MQEMLFAVHGINWNDYPIPCKRGSCCVKGEKGWYVDLEIPIFKGENRAYIEDRINFVDKANEVHLERSDKEAIDNNVEQEDEMER